MREYKPETLSCGCVWDGSQWAHCAFHTSLYANKPCPTCGHVAALAAPAEPREAEPDDEHCAICGAWMAPDARMTDHTTGRRVHPLCWDTLDKLRCRNRDLLAPSTDAAWTVPGSTIVPAVAPPERGLGELVSLYRLPKQSRDVAVEDHMADRFTYDFELAARTIERLAARLRSAPRGEGPEDDDELMDMGPLLALPAKWRREAARMEGSGQADALMSCATDLEDAWGHALTHEDASVPPSDDAVLERGAQREEEPDHGDR